MIPSSVEHAWKERGVRSCRGAQRGSARRSTRRALIRAALAWCALACAGAASGQAKKSPVLIGWLASGSSNEGGLRDLASFKAGMAALGWKERSDYVVEARWGEGQADRLRMLAEVLKAQKPALFVTSGVVATVAAANAEPGIPVVQANGGSPVGRGLAASLARPGGMVTGVTNIVGAVFLKHIELLLAAAPKVQRVGFLADRNTPGYAAQIGQARRAVEQRRVSAHVAEVSTAEEIEPALSRLAKERIEGLILLPSAGLFNSERRRIVQFALAQHWPVIGGLAATAGTGALLGHGADIQALFRRAAYYVDRILKGAKPGDLPIEQPTKFVLMINMKTAKALGITIPQELLLRADEVIE